MSRIIDIFLKWHGDDAARGSNQTAANLQGLKNAAASAAGALGLAAGLAGALKVTTDWLRAAGREAASDEQAFARLGGSLTALGSGYRALLPQAERYIGQLEEMSGIQDDRIAAALQRLITLTGDYNASMSALGLVVKMEMSGMFDMETAARLVAMAQEGVTTQLARQFPELRKQIEALGENATYADKAALAMKYLNEKMNEQAAANIGTYTVQMERLNRQLERSSEAAGKAVNENWLSIKTLWTYDVLPAFKFFGAGILGTVDMVVQGANAITFGATGAVGKFLDDLMRRQREAGITMPTAPAGPPVIISGGYPSDAEYMMGRRPGYDPFRAQYPVAEDIDSSAALRFTMQLRKAKRGMRPDMYRTDQPSDMSKEMLDWETSAHEAAAAMEEENNRVVDAMAQKFEGLYYSMKRGGHEAAKYIGQELEKYIVQKAMKTIAMSLFNAFGGFGIGKLGGAAAGTPHTPGGGMGG